LRGAPPALVLPTHALKALLRRLRRVEQPQVLDLGPAEDANLQFFTQRGCRVSVEDLAEALPPAPERRSSSRVRRAGAPPVMPRLLDERRPLDEGFDLVLCWDLLELLTADAAAGLVAELSSRLRPRGMVWTLFDSGSKPAAGLRRFRILGEDSLEHRLRPERTVTRLVHQNRDVLAMFQGFEVVSSTFLRVGIRELLFAKASPASA
jgi:hypothetical protein